MDAVTTDLHPRPQFARAEWTELDGTWQFAYDDADRGLDERWWTREEPFDREIQVPYPPESALSGIQDRGYHAVVWYRRVFDCPRPDDGDRILVTFGATTGITPHNSLILPHTR